MKFGTPVESYFAAGLTSSTRRGCLYPEFQVGPGPDSRHFPHWKFGRNRPNDIHRLGASSVNIDFDHRYSRFSANDIHRSPFHVCLISSCPRCGSPPFQPLWNALCWVHRAGRGLGAERPPPPFQGLYAHGTPERYSRSGCVRLIPKGGRSLLIYPCGKARTWTRHPRRLAA